MYGVHDYDASFTSKVLWRDTKRALLKTDRRLADANSAMEAAQLEKATCEIIVNSALDGKTECLVTWAVPKLSLQTLGYSVSNVVRNRANWDELQTQAAAAQKALEVAFNVFERGRYEWGGASGSFIDHSATIQYLVDCAQDGMDFSTATATETVRSYLGKICRLPFERAHLVGPLYSVLAVCIPQLSRFKSAEFTYRGLPEELNRGTRISWKDGASGVPFARDWLTALEAFWLARNWIGASEYFRAAAHEAAEGGMHCTRYAICNWGHVLTFFKPRTITEDVYEEKLRADTHSADEECEEQDDNEEQEEVGSSDEFGGSRIDGIWPLEDMFRPLSIALRKRGFTVECIDAALVDGLIPPARPAKSRASFRQDVLVDGLPEEIERNLESGRVLEPKIWLFKFSWLPSYDLEDMERDLENYRFHLEAEMDEPPLALEVDVSKKDGGLGNRFEDKLPF